MDRDEQKKTWVERNSGVIVAVLGIAGGLIGLATAMANHKDAAPASPSQRQGPASMLPANSDAGTAAQPTEERVKPAPVDVSRPTMLQSAGSEPSMAATSQPAPRQTPAGRCSLPGNWQMLEFLPGARSGSGGIPHPIAFTGDAISVDLDDAPPQYRPLKLPCTVEADGITMGQNPDPNIAIMTQLLFPPRYEKQPDGTYKGEKNGSTYYLVRTD